MEFLVHIQVHWPPDTDPEQIAGEMASERARAKELAAEGRIRRLWRIPGRRANWGLWEAADPTALHEALSSLPLFQRATIEVHPLAAHPSDPERPGGR
jgi:muconolactone D-isomerase